MTKQMIRKFLSVCLILVLLLCNLNACGGKVQDAEPTVTVQATEEADVIQTESAETDVNGSEAIESEEQGETVAPTTAVEDHSSQQDQQNADESSALKAELDQLQHKYSELEEQHKKVNQYFIYSLITVTVLLVLAVAFFVLLCRANRKLRKRRPKSAPSGAIVSPIRGVCVGKVHGIGNRNSQQDSFSVTPAEDYSNGGVFAVVADGMGGLKDGDKVSQQAVMSAVEYYLGASCYGMEKIVQILSGVKAGIDSFVNSGDIEKGGTTLLLGLIQDGMFHYASVGDSRICLYRGGELIYLNREHTYLNDLLKQVINGELTFCEAISDEEAQCITSYFGTGSLNKIDLPNNSIYALPGDKFILMSDGVYNALEHKELCLALKHPAEDAANAIESFIRTKNHTNQDNYTAVILECI